MSLKMVLWRAFPKNRHRRLFVGFVAAVVVFGLVVKLLSQGLDKAAHRFNDSDLNRDNFEAEFDSEEELFLDHFISKDEQNAKMEEELTALALSQVGNLPNRNFILKGRSGKFSSCGNFPDLFRLEFSNLHWQVQRIGNLTFYLYRAYVDKRPSKGTAGPLIRILAMVDEPNNLLNVHPVCQFWYQYDNKRPTIVPVHQKLQVWFTKWSKKGKYTAYQLTCSTPESKGIQKVPPISVSLVGHACDNATNNLGIQLVNDIGDSDFEEADPIDIGGSVANKKKLRFGVCVKGLDFLHNDQSYRLIEWIELLLLLGVQKIFFYEFSVHPNVKNVLDYYKKLGKVDVTPLTLPGTLPNEPGLTHLFLSNMGHSTNKRKNEVIPYNDCLYRNLNQFDWIGLLDTDEVIIPKNGNTWEDLIIEIDEQLSNQHNATRDMPITSYCFRNIYFFDSIPPWEKEIADPVPAHLHMMKHIYRAGNYTPPKKFVKCIHSTAHTLLLHNHFPLKCIDGPCNIHQVDVDIAQMQHYRQTCVRDLKNCDDYENSLVPDSTIWKYKDALTTRVNKAISHIRHLE